MKKSSHSLLRPASFSLVNGLWRGLGVLTLCAVMAPSSAWSHGMGGHRHDSAETTAAEQASAPPSTGAEPDGSDPLVTGLSDESETQDRRWGAELGTFFESKHIHYGVTEAEGSPVYGGRTHRLV